jgi:hypothetical protein
MASIHRERSSPDWPLGYINVPTPGTPVNIMSLVDPAGNDDPATPSTYAGPAGQGKTPTCSAVTFQGYQPDAGNSTWTPNSDLVFVMRKGTGTNSGNRTDTGSVVAILPPGGSVTLPESGGEPITSFSPYRYWLDAVSANDGANVVLFGVA